MWQAILLSFGVVFVAELGDKSQLVALTFATRYRALPVLIAIALSTALIHAIAVAVGGAVGAALPTEVISVAAGVAFIAFGAWTLRDDDDDDSDTGAVRSTGRSVVLSVAGVFFLSEFGDKTMLASFTLATENGLVGTWLGATLGMVTADALAIWVGTVLGARLPKKAIRVGSAVAFFVFGAVMIAGALI